MTVPASTRLRSNNSSTNTTENAETTSKPSNSSTSGQQTQTKTQYASKYDTGWRRIVRNFSPSWFSVTMGTGVVSMILHSIPWQASWLYHLSIVFFVLNVALFATAFIISVLRYTIWPEIFIVMIHDPNNSLFLGTIPMGFATIINMWIAVCVPAWGTWAAYTAWGMWMLDSVVAVSVTVSLGVLLMSESHQRSLDTITAAQLLPIAATIVSSSTGSQVAAVLPNPQQALGTIIASYVMWGLSVPMAFTVMAIYFQRLALHKLPAREVIVSAFLPLGPLGLGGYTILNLGRLARDVFPITGTLDPAAGLFAYHLGFFIALLMWSWGLLWFAFALAAIHQASPGLPFNNGWWGFTFPLGVYSISTITIGLELPSLFFRVLGTIFGTAVILLWIVIAARTAHGAWTGTLFVAPCLANLKAEHKVPPAGGAEEEKSEMSATARAAGDGVNRGTPPDLDLAPEESAVEP
ncbi:Plasma membrane sulfite pump involved in sulfite metabolism [Extremus antarcticus]|uniref:Sulfite efflux pump SSU1 n=1 Tax=Extremus antarcticus TaxID=702011 RepID=A0AAJ0GFC6_9PEZI|nr:Plasma membrane sulfite pump involved in sulfite metabolism [Extremus antarcticus]